MKRCIVAMLFCFCKLPAVEAQERDTLPQSALVNISDSITGREAAGFDTVAAETFTIQRYFLLLGSNLKRQFTSPFRASGKDWLRVGGLAAATGVLAFADRPIQQAAVRLRNNNPTVKKVSSVVTEFGGLYEGVTLGALGTYGLIFKKERMITTTLLATQAYITGAAVGTLVKMITARQRPDYFKTDTVSATATFHGPFGGYKGPTYNSSFPSGHATVAFAAATVFAMQYRDKPLVPILAYSAASLISVSRVTENKHWATDVLVGAALGYFSGKKVVGNYRRYVASNWKKKPQGSLSINLQYLDGRMLPGLVYRFR